MKIKPIVLLIVIASVILITACASQKPTPEQIARLQSLTYPENWQDVVKMIASETLFDPYSAHFNFKSPPRKAYFTTGFMYNKGVVGIGHVVVVGVNAKNRYGAYVGEEPMYFVIREDRSVGRLSSADMEMFVHYYD